MSRANLDLVFACLVSRLAGSSRLSLNNLHGFINRSTGLRDRDLLSQELRLTPCLVSFRHSRRLGGSGKSKTPCYKVLVLRLVPRQTGLPGFAVEVGLRGLRGTGTVRGVPRA
jgi:hypothetical protein